MGNGRNKLDDNKKTRPQLIAELNELRQIVSDNNVAVPAFGEFQNNMPEQESEYKSILAHLNVIVLAGNHEKYSYVGGNTEHILGYSLDEWISHKDGPMGFWHEHLDPRDRNETAGKRNKAIEKGEDHVIEYRMIAADGRTVWFHDTVNVEVKDNWEISVRAVMVDITAHKELEDALQKAREELEIRVNDRTRELTIANDKLNSEIVERKLIEEELYKAKEYAQNIIDSSLNMIITADKNRRIVEFNKAACESYGYSKDDVVGKKAGVLFASKKEWRSVFDEVKTHHTYNGEIETVRGNGEKFSSFLSATVMRDKNAKVIGIVGNLQDITERKKAEEKLIESEGKFRSIFDNTSDVIVYVGNTGEIIDINKKCKAVFGYEKDELIGKNVFQPGFINLKYLPVMIREFNRVIKRKKTPGLVELQVYAKNGDELFVEANGHILKKNGGVDGVVVILRDVTGRKKAEEKLRDTEMKLSQATSLAKLGHWDYELSSGEVFWTDEVYEICELKAGKIKLTFEIFMDFIHPEDRFKVEDTVQLSIKTSKAFDTEFKFITSKGNLRYGHIKGEVAIDKKGDAVRLSGMIQDITERKRAEEQIKTSLAEKEVLLREIHHRVKNNMQVISSMLKHQADKIKDKKQFHIFHESINRVHSMALIHTLLYHSGDLSKISFQEYVPKLCNNLIFLYKAQKRGIEICYKIQDIHMTIESAIPCGLIINELVSNTLKHAFPEDRKGTIVVKMRRVRAKKIRLSVSDDGVGMPKEFDFENADSLGLEITHLLSYQIGGKIKHSGLIGTEFAITFKEDI